MSPSLSVSEPKPSSSPSALSASTAPGFRAVTEMLAWRGEYLNDLAEVEGKSKRGHFLSAWAKAQAQMQVSEVSKLDLDHVDLEVGS